MDMALGERGHERIDVYVYINWSHFGLGLVKVRLQSRILFLEKVRNYWKLQVSGIDRPACMRIHKVQSEGRTVESP